MMQPQMSNLVGGEDIELEVIGESHHNLVEIDD
jgi:hypothetical protein